MNYNHQDNLNDIKHTISLGYQIIQSLEAAENSLNSAKNWGIVDMLGGGFLTNVIKHSKINNASNELDYTKSLLDKFRRQVNGIYAADDLHIDLSGFAVFADFFFDGLIADWYVQSKINDNRQRVQDMKRQIRQVIDKLQNLKEYEINHLPGN